MENFESIIDRLINIESLLLSQKKVLNLDEVSVFSGLSKSYLYKLTCSGGIPCYKPQGKHIYFDKVEIEQWLLQNKKATDNEIENKAVTFVTLKNQNSK